MPLSPADNRVISVLSHGPSTVLAIGAACFSQGGKNSGTRPAAAHLARMLARGCVTRRGRFYTLVPPTALELDLPDSNHGRIP